MAISKNWMEMTPKPTLHIYKMKCHLCGAENEIFSDEVYRKKLKCFSCKKTFDIYKSEFAGSI